MIEFNQTTKRYGRPGAVSAALDGVTLSIPSGSVWAVVGPNGAGKSTLLSLLLGFIRPSAGSVTVGDELPRDYLRMHGAGYLPERFALPSGWRVGDALRMFARLERAGDGATDDVIEMFGLDAHQDRKVGELSRGLLQRTGLAQALLTKRSLIVLDEPTEGLDPVWRIRLRDVIADMRSADRTIVIASHDLTELERIADQAIVLEAGSIRNILDVRAADGIATYRITLAEPFDAFTDAFPGASSIDPNEYIVTVTGTTELSQRLAGLLALGAIVASVVPERADLEARVRSTLDGDT